MGLFGILKSCRYCGGTLFWFEGDYCESFYCEASRAIANQIHGKGTGQDVANVYNGLGEIK